MVEGNGFPSSFLSRKRNCIPFPCSLSTALIFSTWVNFSSFQTLSFYCVDSVVMRALSYVHRSGIILQSTRFIFRRSIFRRVYPDSSEALNSYKTDSLLFPRNGNDDAVHASTSSAFYRWSSICVRHLRQKNGGLLVLGQNRASNRRRRQRWTMNKGGRM